MFEPKHLKRWEMPKNYFGAVWPAYYSARVGQIADENQSRLEDYPVLSDDDLSEREQEAADETWQNCYSWEERIKYIRDHSSQFEFHDYADMLGCVRGKYFAGYASDLLY